MYTVEKTAAALIKRFEENGWSDLTLTLKTGDTVCITPCGYGDIKSIKDVDYFLMESDSVNLYGQDKIEKVAEVLNNFSKIKDEDRNEKIELRKFYEDNIKGHSYDEWKLSGKIFDAAYNDWHNKRKSGEDISLVEYLNTYLHEIADSFGLSLEETTRLVKLSTDASEYSDWHKYVYGYRPGF